VAGPALGRSRARPVLRRACSPSAFSEACWPSSRARVGAIVGIVGGLLLYGFFGSEGVGRALGNDLFYLPYWGFWLGASWGALSALALYLKWPPDLSLQALLIAVGLALAMVATWYLGKERVFVGALELGRADLAQPPVLAYTKPLTHCSGRGLCSRPLRGTRRT